jgi:hypothetical protein
MAIYTFSRVAEVIQYFEVEAATAEEAEEKLEAAEDVDRYLIYTEDTPFPTGEFSLTEEKEA